MAARGQVFQDAQSQQQTQPYDSAPVEEITSDGHVDADEEVPATQQDSLVVVEPADADPPTPATLVPNQQPEEAGSKPEGRTSVESTGWKKLRDMSHASDQYCKTCKGHVEAAPGKRVVKKGHAGFQCRVCHNVTTALYRRMDMKNLSYWKALTDHQVQSFFQTAGKCAALNSKMNWRKIQGALVDTCCESEVHRQETAIKGKFLPLSVWASKGYDIEPIEAKGEWQPSDLFGKVYKVPVLQTNIKHIQEEIRTRILQATRAMGRSILANIFQSLDWSGSNRYTLERFQPL